MSPPVPDAWDDEEVDGRASATVDEQRIDEQRRVPGDDEEDVVLDDPPVRTGDW